MRLDGGELKPEVFHHEEVGRGKYHEKKFLEASIGVDPKLTAA